jgi:hypothetical protein
MILSKHTFTYQEIPGQYKDFEFLCTTLLCNAVSTAEAIEQQMAENVKGHFTVIFQHLSQNTKDSKRNLINMLSQFRFEPGSSQM